MPPYRRTFSGDTEDGTFSSRPYSARHSLGLIQPLNELFTIEGVVPVEVLGASVTG
jgi:hypothetical protein